MPDTASLPEPALPDSRLPISTPPDWWRGAVIYQIYPRSFQDTDGDGIGDLDGIRQRLGHVASLGADAVWMSPFYPSPMKDFGYDITDHSDVNPVFGDLDAFDAMLAHAHELGIQVIIDLVLSHTSDQHPWFLESVADREGERGNWYVWADAKADGTAPNNWLSLFGGAGWTWHAERRQYFQHNFLSSQPDLNFHEPAVQDAVLDVARFWLERGVDGFRLDTVNFYFADAEFRDNPPLQSRQGTIELTSEANPYGFQDHLFDKNRPENLAFLERFRAVCDVYPGTAMVGEIGDAQYARSLLRDYTAGKSRLHMCYTFDLLTGDAPTAGRLAELLSEFNAEVSDAWVCWAFSNHDVTRHATRWAVKGAPRVRYLGLLAALLLSLRGSVCLYQGEELGLPEADIERDDIQDPYGLAFWPAYKGRDGCRTPMVWTKAGNAAGFSTARPWLPVPASHRVLAVDIQERDPHGLLASYRRLLSFRRKSPALVVGTLAAISADPSGRVLSFRRAHDDRQLLCAFNLSADTVDVSVENASMGRLVGPAVGAEATESSAFGMATLVGNTLQLPPWCPAWLAIDDQGSGAELRQADPVSCQHAARNALRGLRD